MLRPQSHCEEFVKALLKELVKVPLKAYLVFNIVYLDDSEKGFNRHNACNLVNNDSDTTATRQQCDND